MSDEPPADHPHVVARSLPEANQAIARLSERAGVVSIGEPDSEHPYGFDPEHPLHFRFEFHDVLDPEGETGLGGLSVRPPSYDDVERLIEDVAPQLYEADFVYCHCNAGVSRSTATAFILRCRWLGPGWEEHALAEVIEDRQQALPNQLMVRYADEHLGRSGEMIEVVEAHYDDQGLVF